MNPLQNAGAGYLGGPLGLAQNDVREQQLAQLQQQMAMAQYQNQLNINMNMWGFAGNHFDPEPTPKFEITHGESLYVARFTCKKSGDTFELTSLEKPAVQRGMQHFVSRWHSAIDKLKSAGLLDGELHVALAYIKPRIAEEAKKERDLEEGVRQAEGKAKALLLMCLSPEQTAEFKEHSYFTIQIEHQVRGFPTGAFRVKKGSAFNVEHVESGETFCVVSQEKVPVYDQMLTQKLLLEQEPERFFKTANRSGGHRDEYTY